MSEFTIIVRDIDDNLVPINPRLIIEPERWADAAPGGPHSASIRVSGPYQAIRELFQWLGHRLFISSGQVPDAWHGMISAIDLTLGPVQYRLDLDDVANRIQILYTYEDVNGETVITQTDWATHQPSINRYGYRELRQSESDLDDAQADALLVRVLDALALPHASIDVDKSSESTAMLYGEGLWNTLANRYYSNTVGRIEYTGNSGTEQPLALGFTTDAIGFTVDRNIYEHDTKFAEFETGLQFVVAGTSNDGTYTAAGGSSATEQDAYTADTIYFEGADDIKDYALGLEWIRTGEYAKVIGSSSNSGFHLISSANDGHVTTREGITGTIAGESSGPSITIEQGGTIAVEQGVASYEVPGTAAPGATVYAYGYKIAQAFYNESGAAFTLARIGIRIRKVGEPTADVVVRLYGNNAGVPGSLIESATIDVADIGTSSAWEWATFANTTTLATGTAYWIVIETSDGAVDAENYFRVGINEEAGYESGPFIVHDGSGYVARSPAADLEFKVWGEVETTEQIETIITDAGQFIDSVSIRTDSGISSNQYRDGLSKVKDEVESLLNSGTSAGGRLNATVTTDATVVVESADQPTAPLYVLGNDGVLRHRIGAAVGPGKTVAGEWVEIDDAPGGTDDMVVTNILYVSSSEYDAISGRLRLQASGTPDPWAVGAVVQG